MRLLPFAAAFAAIVALSTPTGLDSCAIGPPIPLFVPVTRPTNVPQFLSGRLGVLLRSYDKRYLIAAYRILSGVPLTEAETAALFPPPQARDYMTSDSPALTAWLSARKAVNGVDPAIKIERYKRAPAKGAYYTFRNCQDAAFDTAVETLNSLRSEWPNDDPRVLEWVRAQDQVFANCSGESPEPVIPAEPTAQTDPMGAKYRKYQIAAALLYAGRHRAASGVFRQIAADTDSPWRSWGRYLSARALLRAGDLDGDLDAFREGKAELLAIIQDPAQSDWHPACLDLLHLWQIRVEPNKRLGELGTELMQPTEDDRSQSFIDFLYLIEHLPYPPARQEFMERQAATGELPAWMVAMSTTPPRGAGALSIEYWRNTRNPAWLVAALINAPASDLPPLLDAARRMPPSAAAYESVVYYALTREIGRGNRTAARQWADRALRRNLLRSTRNLILQERTRIAADWTEFLRFALRRTEPIELFDGSEVEARNPGSAAPVFDSDVITAFNNALPLSLWIDASRSPLLPAPMQLRIAEAGWARAVVLNDFDTAKRLMERVVELAPGSVGASAFLKATDADEARRAAVFIVLRTPLLRPRLPSADQTAPDLATARYVPADAYGYSTCWNTGLDQKFARSLDFLTAAQREMAQAEVKKLQAEEPWEAAFLVRETIAWARAKPDDPRVPEALHRAVMSVRYRCAARGTKLSREAFALLHRRYAKSPWAAKTKYWY